MPKCCVGLKNWHIGCEALSVAGLEVVPGEVQDEEHWGLGVGDGVVVVAGAEASVADWPWVPGGYERVVVENGLVLEDGAGGRVGTGWRWGHLGWERLVGCVLEGRVRWGWERGEQGT